MRIALSFVESLNSFILNEPECEGLPKGNNISVKTRCQGSQGVAPTGLVIEVPGQDEYIAKLIESSATDRETNALLTATLERLETQIAELTERLGKYEGQSEAPRTAGRPRKDR